MSTASCPHCGAEISDDARFCRHCGSSDADGWSDEADVAVDDDFDYDEFVEQHFSDGLTNTQISPIWRFVAVLLLVSFVAWVFVLF